MLERNANEKRKYYALVVPQLGFCQQAQGCSIIVNMLNLSYLYCSNHAQKEWEGMAPTLNAYTLYNNVGFHMKSGHQITKISPSYVFG